MPKPRIGVTAENWLEVFVYFKRAINEDRLFEQYSKEYTRVVEAEQALLAIMDIKGDRKNKCRHAMQIWVDEYVPPKKWERCLKTLRQKKSIKKLTLVRLDLPYNIFSQLKALAKTLNLNLKETVSQLTETELKRHANETAMAIQPAHSISNARSSSLNKVKKRENK